MLKHYIEQIEHHSVLHVLGQVERRKIMVPFSAMERSIARVTNSNRDGIYTGDTIELVGKDGSGKTFILAQLVKHALRQHETVLYIDLNYQYTKTPEDQETYIDLMQPMTETDMLHLIHGLEKWLYDRHGPVVWVMVDGDDQHGLKQQLLNKIKALQYHWSFAFIYTTTTTAKIVTRRSIFDYCFECYKQDTTVCMQLVHPTLTATVETITINCV